MERPDSLGICGREEREDSWFTMLFLIRFCAIKSIVFVHCIHQYFYMSYKTHSLRIVKIVIPLVMCDISPSHLRIEGDLSMAIGIFVVLLVIMLNLYTRVALSGLVY